MEQIKVRLETIQYGNVSLNVAVDISDPEKVYVTFSAAENILDYRRTKLWEKIESKSLKAFLGKETISETFEGIIVNEGKGDLVVNLLKFEDLVKLATWEALNNQNPCAIVLLVVGFSDSFRSLANAQMGIQMETQDRIDRITNYFGDRDSGCQLPKIPLDIPPCDF